MLTMWSAADDEFTTSLCELHCSLTGECLDPKKVLVHRSTICPYDGYELIRISIDAHLFPRPSATDTEHIISVPSISYLLFAANPTAQHGSIVPLSIGADYLYSLNHLFGFKLRKNKFSSYVKFAGMMLSHPPLKFFDNLNSIKVEPRSIAPGRTSIDTILKRNFDISDSGEIDIRFRPGSHPLFGQYIEARFPCLHEGVFYLMTLRFTDTGIQRIESRESLKAHFSFDTTDAYKYYDLEMPPRVAQKIGSIRASISRNYKMISRGMKLEAALTFFVAPIFLFNLFLLFSYGAESSDVLQYFQMLAESRFLRYMSAFVGFILIGTMIFRSAYLELGAYRKRIIPGGLSFAFEAMEAELNSVAYKIGKTYLVALLCIGFLVEAMAGITVFTYGVISVFLLPAFNFGQAIILTLQNIPLLSFVISPMLSDSPYVSHDMPERIKDYAAYSINFIFSTVFLGIIVRVCRILWKFEA